MCFNETVGKMYNHAHVGLTKSLKKADSKLKRSSNGLGYPWKNSFFLIESRKRLLKLFLKSPDFP